MPKSTFKFALALFKAYIEKSHVAVAKLRFWSVQKLDKVRELNYNYEDGDLLFNSKINGIDGIIEFNITSNRREIINYNYLNDCYTIMDNIQIPLGLAFIIPEGYDLLTDSKSGNFKKGYTLIPGKIDENYTYGITSQLALIDNLPVLIKPDEKFTQLIMRKSEHIVVMKELYFLEFETSPLVK
ncbi:MAG: hypothetical protein EZS28_049790, partial [Streblomastix strix]